MPVTRLRAPLFFFWVAICVVSMVPRTAAAEDAPRWMHALVGATLPSYDEKTEAVLLYSETNVTVLSVDKIRTHVREAYKILRPEGRSRGTVEVDFNPERKIKSLYGWCIPAKGKDYEVTERDAIEGFAAPGFVLFTDTKDKVLRIPAPDVGNIVGYEYEVEERPFWLQDIWDFQGTDPVLESHYSLQLPPGWEYKASWLSYPEVKPAKGGGNVWQWVINDVKEIRPEPAMPPLEGVAGQMIVSFFPAGGTARSNEFASWEGMGRWEESLYSGRMDASEPIKQEVNALVAGKPQLSLRCKPSLYLCSTTFAM